MFMVPLKLNRQWEKCFRCRFPVSLRGSIFLLMSFPFYEQALADGAALIPVSADSPFYF